MKIKWVRNDQNDTKWPGYEMTWVPNGGDRILVQNHMCLTHCNANKYYHMKRMKMNAHHINKSF